MDTRVPSRWVEPTARLRLRWGGYRERLALGALLAVAGTVAIAGSTTTTPWLMWAGSTASLAGWCILPSAGWRRVVAIWPGYLTGWLLLTGPRFIWVVTLGYLAWLVVRHRRALCFATGSLVLAGTFLISRIAQDYADMPATLAATAGILVLSGWIARAVHASLDRRHPSRPAANAQHPPMPRP